MVACACGHPPAPPPPPSPAGDPQELPAPVVDHMQRHAWGQMHLSWHTARRWDLLPPASRAFAENQGWTRAPLQEGAPGNGVEFLAMHRMMFQMLREQVPGGAEAFAPWPTPPTEAHAGVAFDAQMLAAIDRIEHHLDAFASEDELGLYIETAMRPVPGNPQARASDVTAGVHNYLHNRFQDRTSPIDLGNPAVNLLNRRFWQLHGWIDQLWTRYRTQKGLRDDDPAYQAALAQAMAAMETRMKAAPVPPPAELVDVLSGL